VLPSLSNSPSWRTRSSFGCSSAGCLRFHPKKVCPGLLLRNDPFASHRTGESSSLVAEQFALQQSEGNRRTIQFLQKNDLCVCCAVNRAGDSSFPVPVSPSIRAVESVGATVRTRSNTSRSAPLAPMISSSRRSHLCRSLPDGLWMRQVRNNAEQVDSAVACVVTPASYAACSARQGSTSFDFPKELHSPSHGRSSH